MPSQEASLRIDVDVDCDVRAVDADREPELPMIKSIANIACILS